MQLLSNKYTNTGHKFAYTKKEKIVVSTTGKKTPNHQDLGNNLEAITAGYVKIEFKKNNQVKKVYFDNRSAIYNSTYESLKKARKFIVSILGSVNVELKNNPNHKTKSI